VAACKLLARITNDAEDVDRPGASSRERSADVAEKVAVG
jgi:hypothetical protein